MKRTSQLFLLIVSGCVAAGCGGGGGGGAILQPPEPVAMTSGNAPEVSGFTIDAILVARSLDDAGLGIVAGVAGTLSSGGGAAARGFRSGRMMRHSAALRAGALETAAATESCIVSGTATITGNIADPETITPGDSASAIFHNCNDGDGIIVDGNFDVTFTAFTGTLDSIELVVMNADFGNFMVTGDGTTTEIDGAADINVNGTDRPLYLVTASGSSVSATVNNVQSTLTNFDVTTAYETDVPDGADLINGTGTVSGGSIGGRVDFEIIDSLSHIEGDDFPLDGQVEINGAENSRVVVTGVNDVDVILDVDTDGDGLTDDSIHTTWTALHD